MIAFSHSSRLHAEPSPLPAHQGTRLLTSGPLTLEVADPEASPPYKTGVRFSSIGLVLRARYKGHSFFWSPTPPNQYSSEVNGDPGGTIMEFDLGDKTLAPDFRSPMFQNQLDPPGFHEARASSSDPFLKIGVGLLERNLSGSYRFSRNWKRHERPNTTADWVNDQTVRFKQTLSKDAHGYRYALEQKIHVENDRFTITTTLKNTGSKPFMTEQYHHNFLSFNGKPVGPEYEVRFPVDIDVRNLPDEQPIQKEKKKLMYHGPITASNKPFIAPSHREKNLTSLTVTHTGTNQALTITADGLNTSDKEGVHIDTTGTAIYSSNTEQLSPEMFITLQLRPGKQVTWTRGYRFEAP